MAFFEASDGQIRTAFPNLDEKKWQAWRAAINDSGIQDDLAWVSSAANRYLIPIDDPRYPPLLRQIADPPVLLFVLGNAELLQLPQLGVVGSRQSTPGGGQICTELCRPISQSGIIITSGMALGIDGAAHRAALDAGGKTIAVVGTGLDRVYPARHLDLAHAIAATGAIVSEFPIGTGVRGHHFPRRNRIISGLSLGVLVVEASVKSGSLITARQAGEQGREVFAVPGSIFSPLSKGCHTLIRQGAKLTETAEDILEELLPLAHASAELINEKPAVRQASEKPQLTLSAHEQKKPETTTEHSTQEQRLLQSMGFDPCRADDLVERTDLTIEQISAMLLMLVLDGAVQELPGGRYQRITP